MNNKPDISAGANLPTINCNVFNITATPANIRLVLGEQLFNDLPPNYHVALSMTAANARWLADVIEKTLGEAEDQALTNKPK